MKTVLILGATGLFGGHLARQLVQSGRFDVICAGRNAAKLAAFCNAHGGRFLAFNRATPDAALAAAHSFAVVDAAGPFQDYGSAPYAFARACLNAGCHYLDLADVPDFVRNISGLNTLAQEKHLTALSGVSTTPALSSAVVAALSSEFESLCHIETTILPGNQTPRGLSVMRAILGQVGQPMQIWENGRFQPAHGWSRLSHASLKVGDTTLSPRPASLINTPDHLLAAHFNVPTVIPRAGLELGLFHHSLRIARFLVYARLFKTLATFARPLHRIAGWFETFGSSAGGMRVRVVGTKGDQQVTHVWDLIAEDGHGPKIPVQPAALMLDKLANGNVRTGARPCISELNLKELETAMDRFGARSEIRTSYK